MQSIEYIVKNTLLKFLGQARRGMSGFNYNFNYNYYFSMVFPLREAPGLNQQVQGEEFEALECWKPTQQRLQNYRK